MTTTARLFILGTGTLFFLVVLRLVHRRQLGLEYSILWLLLAALGILAGATQRQMDAVSRLVGIQYPPTFFLVLCVLVVLAILLHLTVRLSRLADAQRVLAQEIALLKAGVPAPEDSGTTLPSEEAR